MASIKETYKKIYETDRKAVISATKQKQKQIKQNISDAKTSATDTLRAAYADQKRAQSTIEQRSRAAGYAGGTEKNRIASVRMAYLKNAASVQQKLKTKLQSLASQNATLTAQQTQKLAALKSTLDKNLAAADAADAASALKLMKLGIYDAGFAAKLGITDSAVKAYVASVNAKKAASAAKSKTKTTKKTSTSSGKKEKHRVTKTQH